MISNRRSDAASALNYVVHEDDQAIEQKSNKAYAIFKGTHFSDRGRQYKE